MSNPYDTAKPRKASVLGPTLKVKGELTAEEDLMIQGSIEGSIKHSSSLTIGESGHVKANVAAEYIAVEGNVEGDIRAHLLTVGEGATVKGEVVADDVVVNGRVVGRLRGLKVRLTATARVEGDIIHKTIAIESGAHFEGTVQRQDDPLSAKSPKSGS